MFRLHTHRAPSGRAPERRRFDGAAALAVAVAVLVSAAPATAQQQTASPRGLATPGWPVTPETYAATVYVQATAPGVGAQTLEFRAAKDHARRRIDFTLPAVGRVSYLNDGTAKFWILHDGKQYVRLDPSTIGFEPPDLLMPDELVERMQASRTGAIVGTKQIDGRETVGYELKASADTNTAAGSVRGVTDVYVDTRTGLPLRVETHASSDRSGPARIDVAMRDIVDRPSPTLFVLPAGYSEVTGDELRQAVTSTVEVLRGLAASLTGGAS